MQILKVALQKNSKQWFLRSVIAVLLMSISIIAVYPVLSDAGKLGSVELNCESGDQEKPDAEKDMNEEPINSSYVEFSFLKFQPLSFLLKRLDHVDVIPFVFYDIHLLPPKGMIG